MLQPTSCNYSNTVQYTAHSVHQTNPIYHGKRSASHLVSTSFRPPLLLQSSRPHGRATAGRRSHRAVATQSAPRGPSAGQQVQGPRLLPRPHEVGLGASTPASAASHTKAQRCNRLQVGALSVAKLEQIEGVRLSYGYIELSHWVQMW